jgi:hypothetical protein
MVMDLDVTEALALVVAMAGDASFPVSASDAERAVLQAEAMRVIAQHAAQVAQRNLPSNCVAPFERRTADAQMVTPLVAGLAEGR